MIDRLKSMNLNLVGLMIVGLMISTPYSSYFAQNTQSYQISTMFENLGKASNDDERFILHNEMKALVREVLTDFNSAESLSELLALWPAGIATAGKGEEMVTVLSWNSERKDRTQDYGAFVIYGFDKAGQFENLKWTELVHDRDEDPKDESRSYRVDDWPGAIYYDLILTHDGKTPVYTLLGWGQCASHEKSYGNHGYI